MTYRKKPPKEPISLASMINIIARFGGYLNRKKDPEPGPASIWNGMHRLGDFIKAKNIYDDVGGVKLMGNDALNPGQITSFAAIKSVNSFESIINTPRVELTRHPL